MKIKPHLKEELKKYLIEKVRKEEQKIKVFSAGKLDDEDKILIKRKLKSFDFKDVDYFIDPSIMAGVIVKKGSKMIDLSLKGTLSNLKKIVYESD
ncbi:MAG: F0F1 ATP synthase subunit delta [Candidatus Roizmanbacteria bacterium GW2011_GWC2_37_13]|uniref:F0F1 ATP synthase subunit delta n=1 Tax=Candidatus Roizmanbacteria bacterium GW2011_GWC2_37_13 TaxID=1618486 RepID=A0A0G0G1H0_9BACT|nr:MAG: F0F1 ATP synthase subunit delta [Candidatus Roizmanbacteria bacterium GW2011_GWC1_37_12]KKQ25073.1 MAG: F0F1 ATP synthase subunit delta [Candidatus Roizmanbacteria bacterium GW2011_GWC2_37_13]